MNDCTYIYLTGHMFLVYTQLPEEDHVSCLETVSLCYLFFQKAVTMSCNYSNIQLIYSTDDCL